MTQFATRWLILASLLVVFIVGLVSAVRESTSWDWAGVVAGDSSKLSSPIEQVLSDGETDDGTIKTAFAKRVAWFKTPNGRMINVWVRSIHFSDKGIEGLPSGKSAGALLINSVDENQNWSGGISGVIGRGCDLSTSALTAGEVAAHTCAGIYRTVSGISEVDNIAVVTYNAATSQSKPTCFERYFGSDDEKYASCVQESVTHGFQAIFNLSSSRLRPFDRMIVPAVGTGNGPLDKAGFYHIFFSTLSSALGSDKVANKLPSEIDLAVWPGDAPGSYSRSIDGIRDGAESATSTWLGATHPPRSDAWLRISGVCGGLSVLTIAMMHSKRIAMNYPDIFMSGRTKFLRLLSILAMSYGLADGIAHIIPSIGWEDPIVQVALGLLIVPFTAPLMRALQQTQKEMDGTTNLELHSSGGYIK